MSHNDHNHNFDDDDRGIFMKQESVTSVFSPTPMTPTTNGHKTFLGSAGSSPCPPISEQVKRNPSYGNLGNQTEARVLVMYTGGTIGMLRNDKNGEESIYDINCSLIIYADLLTAVELITSELVDCLSIS